MTSLFDGETSNNCVPTNINGEALKCNSISGLFHFKFQTTQELNGISQCKSALRAEYGRFVLLAPLDLRAESVV